MNRQANMIFIKQLERDSTVRALLGWDGAGNANDDDILSLEDITRIASSFNPMEQQVPVLLQHDWDVRAQIGEVVKVDVYDGMLIATMEIHDEEALRKIHAGEWRNVSIGYTFPSMEILEVSIVAIPAIRGARILPEGEKIMEETVLSEMEQAEMVEVMATETAEVVTEAIEETAEEVVEMSAEPAEEVIALSMHNDSIKTYELKLESLVRENAQLTEELEVSRKEVQAVAAEFEAYKRDQIRLAECQKWLDSGKSTVAQHNIEKVMCLTMTNEQFEQYKQVKGESHSANPFTGTVAKVDVQANETNAYLNAYRKWRESHQ